MEREDVRSGPLGVEGSLHTYCLAMIVLFGVASLAPVLRSMEALVAAVSFVSAFPSEVAPSLVPARVPALASLLFPPPVQAWTRTHRRVSEGEGMEEAAAAAAVAENGCSSVWPSSMRAVQID